MSYIFRPGLLRILNNLGNIFYSAWLQRSFKSCSGVPKIEYPIFLTGSKYISIGKDFETRGRLRLEAYDTYNNHTYTPEIIIGNNVSINFNCHFGAINRIVIGNDVLIGSQVLITDHFHGKSSLASLAVAPKYRDLFSKGPVFIEDGVWIGEGAVIMPNVTVGRNAIIGSNAVVTKSVPSNHYAIGAPARFFQIK